MTIVHLSDDATLAGPSVVCLGYFDGVHLGHAALLKRACEIAHQNSLKVYAHTFDSPPSQHINPGRFMPELTPLKKKASLMGAFGVESIGVSKFDDAMMNMTGKDFIINVICGKMHAVHIVAGFHHVFGHCGDTDTMALQALCSDLNIGCDILQPVLLDTGELISSTAIRKALESKDFSRAEKMLGRPCDDYLLSIFKRNKNGGKSL